MFEIKIKNRITGQISYEVRDVALIRHITPSEIGFTDTQGHIRSISLTLEEDMEINRQ